jgi:hypothetical protein
MSWHVGSWFFFGPKDHWLKLAKKIAKHLV